jgi:hypothetical protein
VNSLAERRIPDIWSCFLISFICSLDTLFNLIFYLLAGNYFWLW